MTLFQAVMAVLGVSSLGLFLAGWVAYPIGLRLLKPRSEKPAGADPGDPPRVDVILATRQPPDEVADRVSDILMTGYPEDRLGVVVAVDHRSSTSAQVVAAALPAHPRVQVVEGDPPGGKAAALNAAVRVSDAEILVFTDTAQRFERQAIPRLVECLQHGKADGASGFLRAAGDKGALGRFWSYETMVRGLESSFDSLVGVTGAVYALRRSAWHDLRPGVINDDLVVPLQARQAGARVLHCPDAVAIDLRTFTRDQQYQRRVRTLTGVLQVLAWYPWTRSPFRNPLWVQFTLHKLMRVATPFLLGLSGLAFLVLAGWQITALVIVLLALLGLVGAAAAGWPPDRFLGEVAWALRLLLLAPLAATRNAIRGNWDVWSG